MGFVRELENQVMDVLVGDYKVIETRAIPSVEDVPDDRIAEKMNLCVLYIDLRGSSELLRIHQNQSSGKVHKAFLTVVSQVVLRNGGEIHSFDGDGLLAFWPANYQSEISKVVRAALETKWLLDVKLSSHFEIYDKLDFGIGVDCGEVYIVRAGISRDTINNDLVFIGRCIDFATKLAHQATEPHHIEISDLTYNNLDEDCIYYKVKTGQRKKNMWERSVVEWNGGRYNTKTTIWQIQIDE